jgi:mycothiol synthase
MTSVRKIGSEEFVWATTDGAAGSAETAEAVRRIAAAASEADGRSPLNEAALLGLRHSGLAGSALWVASEDGDGGDRRGGVGFALADAPAGTSDRPVEVNLVVAPDARRRGVAAALAAQVLQAYPDTELAAWSHGNHPGAASLAKSLGFDRVRDLWVMRRSLTGPLPALPTDRAAEVDVRPFRPGQDEDAFLEVNAAAFAHHPEQGSMTRADLDQREAEDWFDPAGFFLAVRAGGPDAGSLLGFHWTKVHAEEPPFGEVYVVGVSPAAQGLGLGKLLTLTGLHHLAGRGLGEVILYVESDNAAAVATYAGLGFTHAEADTDVMYRRPRG